MLIMSQRTDDQISLMFWIITQYVWKGAAWWRPEHSERSSSARGFLTMRLIIPSNLV